MRFILPLLAPEVERVVHHHAMAQHLVVVRKAPRQAQRNGGEARGLGREIEPGRVRAAHDQREPLERRIA